MLEYEPCYKSGEKIIKIIFFWPDYLDWRLWLDIMLIISSDYIIYKNLFFLTLFPNIVFKMFSAFMNAGFPILDLFS